MPSQYKARPISASRRAELKVFTKIDKKARSLSSSLGNRTQLIEPFGDLPYDTIQHVYSSPKPTRAKPSTAASARTRLQPKQHHETDDTGWNNSTSLHSRSLARIETDEVYDDMKYTQLYPDPDNPLPMKPPTSRPSTANTSSSSRQDGSRSSISRLERQRRELNTRRRPPSRTSGPVCQGIPTRYQKGGVGHSTHVFVHRSIPHKLLRRKDYRKARPGSTSSSVAGRNNSPLTPSQSSKNNSNNAALSANNMPPQQFVHPALLGGSGGGRSGVRFGNYHHQLGIEMDAGVGVGVGGGMGGYPLVATGDHGPLPHEERPEPCQRPTSSSRSRTKWWVHPTYRDSQAARAVYGADTGVVPTDRAAEIVARKVLPPSQNARMLRTLSRTVLSPTKHGLLGGAAVAPQGEGGGHGSSRNNKTAPGVGPVGVGNQSNSPTYQHRDRKREGLLQTLNPSDRWEVSADCRNAKEGAFDGGRVHTTGLETRAYWDQFDNGPPNFASLASAAAAYAGNGGGGGGGASGRYVYGTISSRDYRPHDAALYQRDPRRYIPAGYGSASFVNSYNSHNSHSGGRGGSGGQPRQQIRSASAGGHQQAWADYHRAVDTHIPGDAGGGAGGRGGSGGGGNNYR